MKQVFLQKGQAVVHQVPAPDLQENVLLVRVHYSFISSGTESATLGNSGDSLLKRAMKNPAWAASKFMGAVAENGLQGTMALLKGKQLGEISAIGYSCAGQVIATGKNITKFRVGDYVACAGAGIANHADVVAVPENLSVKVTDTSFLQQSSITTIGAIALQGIRRADLRLGETVCVIGLGLLGQLTVQLAKASGCKVFGVDLDPARVALAKELGADYTYVGTDVDLEKEITFATQHYGVDTTIIAAAAPSGTIIDQSMALTRRKGKVVLVGDVKIDFERNPFYAKEIDFLVSCSYGPGRYDPTYELMGQDYPLAYVRWTENRNMQLFVQMVESGRINIDKMISQVFTIDDAEQAYQSLQAKTALGLVLDYQAEKNEIKPKLDKSVVTDLSNAVPYKAPTQNINVGFVGVGGFAKVKLLPNIKKCDKVAIHCIVDADISNATNIAAQYSAPKTARQYSDIVGDKDLNAVVIATPHAQHTQQALDFLKQGKAVFLEKPAAVTREQLAQLETFFKNNENALFTVDFNRSWAPFNQAIAKQVAQRSTPLVAHYRMNAGYIPKTHWIQSDEHRGRIIGEACHIFELFCALTQAHPVSVSVASMQPNGDDLCANDNINAQIQFDDGSTCTLLYTAVGNNQLAKERMELFYDGKAIVMDDYKELKGYGLPSSFNKKSRSVHKGHEELITEFFKQACSEQPVNPIPIERILMATHLSILVDDLARAGGGYRTL